MEEQGEAKVSGDGGEEGQQQDQESADQSSKDKPVSRAEAEAYANESGLLFGETSAKTNVGVQEVYSTSLVGCFAGSLCCEFYYNYRILPLLARLVAISITHHPVYMYVCCLTWIAKKLPLEQMLSDRQSTRNSQINRGGVDVNSMLRPSEHNRQDPASDARRRDNCSC